MYSAMPWLRRPENDLALFLCHCANMASVDPALWTWAKSAEGVRFHKQTMGTLAEANNPEQAILSLSALVWREQLLSYGPDEVSRPIHGCFLEDFAKLLHGQQLKNQLAVFKRMVSRNKLGQSTRRGKAGAQSRNGPDGTGNRLITTGWLGVDRARRVLNAALGRLFFTSLC